MKKEIKPSDAVSIGAILLLAATLFWLWFMPLAPSKAAETNAKIRKATLTAGIADKDAIALRAQVRSQLWPGDASSVGPLAFALVQKLAEKHNVHVTAYRPQKAEVTDVLTYVAFTVVVDGRAGDIADLASDIEKPANLVGLTSISVSNSDGATDHVSGTIGVAALAAGAKRNG